MLEIGQKIRATCEKLIFHGKGLIRYEGWVIFVDDILPAEEVIVEILQKKEILLHCQACRAYQA